MAKKRLTKKLKEQIIKLYHQGKSAIFDDIDNMKEDGAE